MRKWLVSFLFLFFVTGCSSSRMVDKERRNFSVLLTLPLESESVEATLVFFDSVPGRMYSNCFKVSSDQVVIFYNWAITEGYWIENIKNYCSEIRDKVEVEYQ